MDMSDRIRSERKALGLSQGELAAASGVKQQMISKLETGAAKSTGDLPAIARALKVIPWWLQTGQGPKKDNPVHHGMYADASSGSEPVSGINHNQQAAQDFLASAPPSAHLIGWENKSDLPDGYCYIDYYEDVQLSAGAGAICWDEQTSIPLAFRLDCLGGEPWNPKNVRVLKVKGDSMEPTMEDGHAAVIDITASTVYDNAIYALMYHGELFVKRLFRVPGGGIEMRSDNPIYKPRFIEGEDLQNLVIIGEMIFSQGPRKRRR